MSTFGNSGCFISPDNGNGVIDNLHETREAVADIVGTPAAGQQPTDMAVVTYGLSALRQFIRRVDILTYAVIALAVVVIMREVD